MATTRTRTKPTTTAEDVEPLDDAPSFTTAKPKKVVYDGPVLFRLDGQEYRMRPDRSFAASLVYLHRLGNGSGLRQAQFAVLDYVVGPEATARLVHSAELDPAAWNQVVNRALEHVLGKLKEEPGN